MARSFFYVLVPDREPKFPDGALFIPIKSDRISLVKRKDKASDDINHLGDRYHVHFMNCC